MKTAILMSGLPREVAQCWPGFLDHVVRHFPDADLFVYTGEPFPDLSYPGGMQVRYEAQVPRHELEAVLSAIGYHAPSHANAYAQQVWGWRAVWELMEQHEAAVGQPYDLVIRTRPDLLFLRDITPARLDLTKINTLHGWHPSPLFVMPIEFAVGPRAAMQDYMHLYDWLLAEGRDELLKPNPLVQTYGPYHCDLIMSTYLLRVKGHVLADYPKGVLVNGVRPVQGDQPEIYQDKQVGYAYYRIAYIHANGTYTDIPLTEAPL